MEKNVGEHHENEITRKKVQITKLIIVELVEGFVPVIYGISMSLAYYGPNSALFANISSRFWGKPIEDIRHLYYMTLLWFSIDVISATLNSICLWKVLKLNMLQELASVLNKYWHFMVVKFGYDMVSYFASTDINFGFDSTHNFRWITLDGRLYLIYNSTDLNDEEKDMLLDQTTLH